MKIAQNVALAFCLALVWSVSTVEASVSVGTIDSSSKFTRVCQDTSCSDFGNINWKPTINSMTPGAQPVTITDSSITGHLWGDEIGWINLAPTGAGVTVNPNTGVVSGRAFANSGSWINFNTTGQGVTLVDNGSGSNFSGFAWVSGANGGWMKFDCSSGDTCIKTDWRIISQRATTTATTTPPSSGGGGSGGGKSGGENPPGTTDSVPGVDTPPSVGVDPESPTPPFAGGLDPVFNTDSEGVPVPVSFEASQGITPETFSGEGVNPFDNNGDGIPDSMPGGEDTSINEASNNLYSVRVRQLFPVFQSEYETTTDCSLCIVAKEKKSVDQKSGQTERSVLIKYGFTPESMEIGIPIPFTNDTEADVSSLLLTVLAGVGLRRFLLRLLVSVK
jgi:hypothetical protein